MNKIWKIEAIECNITDPEYSDIIQTVHWRLNADDGQYSSTVYGSISLPFDKNNITQYTKYEDTTHEQIIEWVKTEMGQQIVQEYEIIVENQIKSQKSPVSIIKPLPWSN